MTTTPANGTHTDNGRPHSCSSITPFLAVHPAADAIDFYVTHFGATVIDRLDGPDGTVIHADLGFPVGRLQLGDPDPRWGVRSPDPADDTVTASFAIYVPNVDEVVTGAVAAGARLREEPADFVSGDRFASIADPFGVRWSIMTRIEDISDDESARRVAEWAASLSQ